MPPYQGLGLGSTFLRCVYDYYLKDKQCVEFSVEEPSDEFQSLMDLIEIKFLWQAGFFKSIKRLFKNKRPSLKTINCNNFDDVYLDNEEIMQIQKVLKLTKPRIIRCFELIVLAKLDPKDSLVHQRFGQEIKKKLQQQLTKNILAPYFQIENFQPQSNVFINSSTQNAQDVMFGPPLNEDRRNCCQGDGLLFCLKEPQSYQHVEVKNIDQQQPSYFGSNDQPGSSLISKHGGGHAGQLRNQLRNQMRNGRGASQPGQGPMLMGDCAKPQDASK